MGELEAKKKFVDDLAMEIGKSKGIYLAESSGVVSNDMNELRKKFRESGSRYIIAKNRLAKKALKKAGVEGLDGDLLGPTSMILSFEDPVAPAKLLSEFRKGNSDKFKLKSCFVEGKVLSAGDVDKLASVPSKEVLLGQLCSVLNAPTKNVAVVLSEILAQVPRAIDAVAKGKA